MKQLTHAPTKKRSPSAVPTTSFPNTPPTEEPSFRPKLYITIGQSSGDTLNIAEVWFYSQGRRLPSSLFKPSATSFFGTFLGPVVDPLGDFFGGPELVIDGDLRTSTRTHNSLFDPYYTTGPKEFFPRIILTTHESTHFDQIVIYNRRLPKAQHRDAGAFIQVLWVYTQPPHYNITLWQSNLKGTHYVYNFTDVNSGNAAPAESPIDQAVSEGPTYSPTLDPTIYYYYSPPVPGKAPTKLVITIDQPNGNSLLVAEVQFKLNGQTYFGQLLTTSTSKRVPGVLNGKYPYGLESQVIDGNLNTFFWSLNSTVDDDADPTLIIYEQDYSSGFYFDEMTVYNVAYQPLQYKLVGARISVFFFSSQNNRYFLFLHVY